MNIPAAQYLRTSHDEQQCSLALQIEAIRNWAGLHGFTVVKTYKDEARSGLLLKQRPGLRRLLRDAVEGNASYKAVLVLDVSRWGRFQDPDEAAHYEYLCKHAGTPVHYCAEAFENNSTLLDSALKGLKRSMAAEYSRELSVKCFNGQKRLFDLGFHVGGVPGYGLRRMVISANGKHKRLMLPGERKPLSNDRVVLVPGELEEIASVRKIFQMAVRENSPTQIARDLNALGLPYIHGKPWNDDRVSSILRNPKYAGCNVWNRISSKLQGPQVRNPPHLLLMNPGAIPAIVSRATFDRVQKRRDRKWSNEVLLRKLGWLFATRGRLTAKLINDTAGMPSANTYYDRFGNLLNAYRCVGYRPAFRLLLRGSQHRAQLQFMRGKLINNIVELFPGRVDVCRAGHIIPPVLRVENTRVVRVIVCRRRDTRKGKTRWCFSSGATTRQLILVGLLDKRDDSFSRYYLLPRLEAQAQRHQLKADDLLRVGAIRLHRLCQFLGAVHSFPLAAQQRTRSSYLGQSDTERRGR